MSEEVTVSGGTTARAKAYPSKRVVPKKQSYPGSTPVSAFTFQDTPDKSQTRTNNMSEEVTVSGGTTARTRVSQVGQNAAKVSESWIVNAALAPADLGKAVLYAAKSTWQTRGAFAFGALVVICGIGPAFGLLGNFAIGALTAGSDRPLPRESTISAQLGRGTFRTGGAVLSVVSRSVNEGIVASQADDRDRDRTASRTPSRVRNTSNRRPDAYNGR